MSSLTFAPFESLHETVVARVSRPKPDPKWRRLDSSWLNGTVYYFDPVQQHIWGICGFDKSVQFTKPEERIFKNLVETNNLRISPHVSQPSSFTS